MYTKSIIEDVTYGNSVVEQLSVQFPRFHHQRHYRLLQVVAEFALQILHQVLQRLLVD